MSGYGAIFCRIGIDVESLYLLVPVALVFLVLAVRIFFWAVNSGQYDDLDTEAHRILFDDEPFDDEPFDDEPAKLKRIGSARPTSKSSSVGEEPSVDD